jgi:GNAT superfamily N-acetyltransferase
MKCNKSVLNDKTQLIKYMEMNMQGKLAYIPSRQKEMDVLEYGDVLVVNSNFPSDTFNTTYGGSITKEHADFVFDYYKIRNLPMAWWIGPNSQTTESGSILQNAGFHHVEHDVGMVCDLTAVTLDYELPASLEIKECTLAQSFSDFGAVLASIFTPEDEFVKTFYNKLAELDAASIPALKLFVGYEDGKAVAISGLFLTECAGFFDIATRPFHQKKGYGSAMFYTALVQAKKLGYEVGVLQASPDGLNIYKRFGFNEVCDFNVWSYQ